MPTENDKNIYAGEVFIKNMETGEVQNLVGITNIESEEPKEIIKVNERENKASFTVNLTLKDNKRFLKMVGLNPISQKRFRKLLQSLGIQRNIANYIVGVLQKANIRYTPAVIQAVAKITEEGRRTNV